MKTYSYLVFSRLNFLLSFNFLPRFRFCMRLLCVLFFTKSVSASTLNFELGAEYQYFPHANEQLQKHDYSSDATTYLRVKYDESYREGSVKFSLDGTATYDQRDEHRTRNDFNALALGYFTNSVDITVGIKTEFWGVTESRHLVDIINQTVVADNIDEESKLGQPMIKAQLHQSWGNIQLYLLPVFRERIFTDDVARLQPGLAIDDELSRYESSNKKQHRDFALRYTNTLDIWDLGLAYFRGTGRDPLLLPQFTTQNTLVLAPYYEQIEQSSIDLQMTSDSLLLKLEAINHSSKLQKNYVAAVGGFEYTQVGIFDTAMDLGYMVEYLYDERDDRANTPFADDYFAGFRLIANDIAQSTYLLGTYVDRDNHSKAVRFEMETRLRDGLTFSIEGQAFTDQAPDDLLYSFRNDDYLTIGLHIFF